MKKGLLIVMSGPSGVGKGTVREKIINDPKLNLFYSISMTTRAMRAGEKDGREYFFVSQDEFDKHIENDDFLEYARFVNHSYGTPRPEVQKHLDLGENVFLEIEVNGARQVIEKMPDALTIFLMPPSFEELERRIRERCSETEEQIQKRLARAKTEMTLTDNYKYVVINDDLDRTADEIRSIILKESSKE